MLPFPLYLQLGFGFVSGALSASLGLVLVHIFPQPKKVVLTGLCYMVALALVRSLSLPFGVPFAILTLFLAVIIMPIWRLSLFKSILVTVIGTLILVLAESVFSPLILNFMNINFDDMVLQPQLAVFMPLPQIILSIIIIFVCLKFNLHIFDFRAMGVGDSLHLNGKRLNIVLGLVFSLLSLIIVQIVCNATVFNVQPNHIFKTISSATVGYITNIAVVLLFIIIILLIIQFIELTDKESQFMIQSSYLDSIEELYTALRAQKHDLVNHWQVLYGLMQLGDLEEAQKYLEEMMGKSISSDNFVVTGEPGLSALLYIKSGIALSEGIKFDVSVEALMDQELISTYELNRVIGNLINNAFDSVMNLEEERRIVQLKIFDEKDKQVVEVANCGNIEEEIKEKMFQKGFSTKTGKHSGLGLYIVKELLEQRNGLVRVENRGDMAVFSIYIPKGSVTKGGVHARSSRKDRGMAG
ncbi:MAG: Spo0B domain-containing protein [Syntrophomonas sp.]|uniref:sensor histidine kinase n=1 Tax=Syntrophomonas sp. TaxID=2053627 RepID=UPI0026163B33|nr:Spo0B domain-containing protein [Syntrophomonas sp.]MDD2511289.1 Spo0B domain-containing protein [Syntrophomonas sp.]MDD3879887.1 Spo0B domain-containing protein [Syntrophomonas sp.]MDD4627242.1 Spo0B domain-containing protein [Syntrophomonas sp.]